MNLIIDIGNTEVKQALFEGEELVHMESGSDWTSALLQRNPVEHVMLCSVRKEVKKLADKIRKIGYEVLVLDEQTPVPLPVEYKTPETLGYDRLANAAYAHRFCQAENALVIDMGTCIKYDWLIRGKYVGGSISPGFNMRLQALHNQTAKLPLLHKQIVEQQRGDDTHSSMYTGVYQGIVHEVKGFVAKAKADYEKIEVVLTGGDSNYFDKALKNMIFADAFVTLKGLNQILIHKLQSK